MCSKASLQYRYSRHLRATTWACLRLILLKWVPFSSQRVLWAEEHTHSQFTHVRCQQFLQLGSGVFMGQIGGVVYAGEGGSFVVLAHH